MELNLTRLHIFNLPWSIMWVTLPSCLWYWNSSQEPLFQMFKWCGKAANWLPWQVLHFALTCLWIPAHQTLLLSLCFAFVNLWCSLCTRSTIVMKLRWDKQYNRQISDFFRLVRRTFVMYLPKKETLYKIETKQTYNQKALTVHGVYKVKKLIPRQEHQPV